MRNGEDIAALLHRLADASADAILPRFRVSIPIEDKGIDHYDPVTEADRSAEAAIRKILKAQCPDDGIIGEEHGVERHDADYVWVIDPIDGTRAFVQGLPTWGTLVGLLYQGQPIAGMMSQPYTGERFWSDGQKSYFRGQNGDVVPLIVRTAELAKAQMSTTDPYLFCDTTEKAIFERLRKEVRVCRFGADCYAYSLVAAGQIDIVLESSLQIYDIVALIPIIENAGGRVTSWDGGAAHNGGQIIACGDPQLHAEVIELLQSVQL